MQKPDEKRDRIVLWDLHQIDITEEEAKKLLEGGMIYDPNTPEYPMENTFYPEDDYTMDQIWEAVQELRKNPD